MSRRTCPLLFRRPGYFGASAGTSDDFINRTMAEDDTRVVSPGTGTSVTSASGLDATTTSFVRSLRPGAVRWICWVVGGSRKWRAVTIHERRVTASDATTTPEADRRPPPSRSHRSWTVDGRIFRMTSSRVVSEPLEAHPVARRVRTATPRASLMPAHSDREHPGQQILSSASGVAQPHRDHT